MVGTCYGLICLEADRFVITVANPADWSPNGRSAIPRAACGVHCARGGVDLMLGRRPDGCCRGSSVRRTGWLIGFSELNSAKVTRVDGNKSHGE
jgi:hypothetical protein